MNISNQFKILWISDIHFQKKYVDKGLIQDERLATLIQRLVEKTSGQTFEYILLSGDIANEALKVEYDYFNEFVLEKIINNLSVKPIVLMVPGNHDVNLFKAPFLSEFYAKIKIKKFKKLPVNQLKNELLENKSTLIPIFEDYLNFFIQHKDKDCFELNCPSTFVYIDHSHKVIFVLLNSSWFSLSKKYNEILSDYILNKDEDIQKSLKSLSYQLETINKEELIQNKYFEARLTLLKQVIFDTSKSYQLETNNKDKLIQNKYFEAILALLKQVIFDTSKFKDALAEYGGQKTGIDENMIEELNEIILNHPNYLVLSCSHHPFNWLDAFEKYDSRSEQLLNQLLKHSQIHLTSHEHVPSSIKYEKLHTDTIHFKSGMLLQDDIKHYNYGENRFSVLNIDINKKRVRETKFVYNHKYPITSSDWEELPITDWVDLKPNKAVIHDFILAN